MTDIIYRKGKGSVARTCDKTQINIIYIYIYWSGSVRPPDDHDIVSRNIFINLIHAVIKVILRWSEDACLQIAIKYIYLMWFPKWIQA